MSADVREPIGPKTGRSVKQRIADALYKFGRQVDEVLYGRELAVGRYHQEQVNQIWRSIQDKHPMTCGECGEEIALIAGLWQTIDTDWYCRTASPKSLHRPADEVAALPFDCGGRYV